MSLGGPVGVAGGPDTRVRAFAPGRVNLIGEHTDYTGGRALPMAVHLGTTIEGVRRVGAVALTSSDADEPARLELPVDDPATVEPTWARYVAGVAHELATTSGLDGSVTSTLPVGAGLSSSAALELASALALGFVGDPLALARLGQRAEQLASGVPCGLMDQLASACGVEGHALLIDFTTTEVTPVPVPEGIDVVVVHSGQSRTLVGSAYADRRRACEQAAGRIGPLADADEAAVATLDDPVLRRRARHVVTENARVLDLVAAFDADDRQAMGDLLVASHRSLAEDFEVSTPVLDALVEHLVRMPGVLGARLTGAGFGGCVVALTEPGALTEGWTVRPAGGARIEVVG